MAALLGEAQERHSRRLIPAPDLGLGRIIATQAVEYTRLSRVADELWARQTQSPAMGAQHKKNAWRARLFASLYRWHEPFYRWYSSRGMDWFAPMRESIKRWLLR